MGRGRGPVESTDHFVAWNHGKSPEAPSVVEQVKVAVAESAGLALDLNVVNSQFHGLNLDCFEGPPGVSRTPSAYCVAADHPALHLVAR